MNNEKKIRPKLSSRSTWFCASSTLNAALIPWWIFFLDDRCGFVEEGGTEQKKKQPRPLHQCQMTVGYPRSLLFTGSFTKTDVKTGAVSFSFFFIVRRFRWRLSLSEMKDAVSARFRISQPTNRKEAIQRRAKKKGTLRFRWPQRDR